jgi:uncharacterized protein
MIIPSLKARLLRRAARIGLPGIATALLLGAGTAGAAEAPGLPPLTANAGNPRLPGKFVWVDLVTDDVPAARKFYSRLFGWTFREVGNYTIAANDERPLAGLLPRVKPAAGAAKPRWFGYLSVASVARAEKAVTKAGGKVLAAPQTFPKRGEQAIFADPEGAVFGVIKSSAGDPQDFLPDNGDWVWIELLSHDARKAGEFYRAIGGYEVVENTTSARTNDYVLVSKGYARAAVLTIPTDQEKVRPNWLPFVRVPNVNESVKQAKELGGQVLLGPQPELMEGKVAIIADPTGAAIGIMEWSDAWLKGAR